jgi:hypothetical protein
MAVRGVARVYSPGESHGGRGPNLAAALRTVSRASSMLITRREGRVCRDQGAVAEAIECPDLDSNQGPTP